MTRKKFGEPTDTELIENHPDNGCKIWHSCLTCPYQSVSITVQAGCVDDYPLGKASLIRDIRESVLAGLATQDFSVTILSEVFNMTNNAVRQAIYRYSKSVK